MKSAINLGGKHGSVHPNDVPGLSDDEHRELRGAVEVKINEIKAQLSAAKAKRIETGEFSDAQWFSRANGALRVFGQFHQQLLADAARRKQERRYKEAFADIAFEQYFVKMAYKFLSDADFKEIVRLAKVEMALAKSESALEVTP